ncbi:MAG: hypothetical protein A2086_02800 [Spirochaetes bacterium GWD1_27_9]|nr:MAG: hypothetical protein A2Z98_14475 [Spirochaetes bacterium GWB1_27_13]OHD27261.1 MAG: hypothetical protein A2Y34_17200 [Spirochaetes bacterium GWC1_27_15]OHD31380.1 MAG: hypothetical protein A2086_02800 [Spirochaetes bacterium GWD1_27_9]
MKHFKEVFKKFLANIVINTEDSDIDRAKKIIWYVFFGSIGVLILVSWIIFVTLTFTTDIVKVPNIEKDNIYVALKKLSERKLVANVSPKFSEMYSEGTVFTQSPIQGSIVKVGRRVSFSVSLGSQKKALQDFRGYSIMEFWEFLSKEYPDNKIPYKIETPLYEFNEKVEKGKIIRQEPKDGTQTKNVKTLKLWVSNGKKEGNPKTLKSYIGQKIDAASKEIAGFELNYNYVFNIVKEQNKDMVITEQSIGEGAIIDDVIKEGKVLTFTVNKYFIIENEKITSTYLLDLPKKPINYKVEIKLKSTDGVEKTIYELKTKGGISVPVPYSTKINAKLTVYIDGGLYKELVMTDESKAQ